MKDGDVVVMALPQQDGTVKDRPALCLRRLPPFQDLMVCGISTQLQQFAPELDETITPADSDFRTSGLKAPSLIRLGYLAVVPATKCRGRIGSISETRLDRLLTKLSDFICPKPTSSNKPK